MHYVISDLHGYPHDRFLRLLETAGFSDEDDLWILGDVIDRNGDGGVETLLWLLEQWNARLLLGNHEAMLLGCSFLFQEITEDALARLTPEQIGALTNYQRNGGDVTLRALRRLPRETQEAILDYLWDAPLYEEVRAGDRAFLLVHAGLGGFTPEKPLEDYQPDDLLWHIPAPEEVYFPDRMVIFGHTPTMHFGVEYTGKICKTPTWMDIDVGAGFGQEPVLLRLEDLREFRLEP